MELKEYIQLIKRYKQLFILIWLGFIAVVIFWYAKMPVSYDVSLAIDIARNGIQQTTDYQYDQFYRIQADEKFAETVVQWLKDPSLVNRIFAKPAINQTSKNLRTLSKTFRAEKLSPNYVQVVYSVDKADQGAIIADSMAEILNQKTKQLNGEAPTENWFKLIIEKPMIVQAKINWLLVIVAAVIFGFIISIVVTLVKHYWQDENWH